MVFPLLAIAFASINFGSVWPLTRKWQLETLGFDPEKGTVPDSLDLSPAELALDIRKNLSGLGRVYPFRFVANGVPLDDKGSEAYFFPEGAEDRCLAIRVKRIPESSPQGSYVLSTEAGMIDINNVAAFPTQLKFKHSIRQDWARNFFADGFKNLIPSTKATTHGIFTSFGPFTSTGHNNLRITVLLHFEKWGGDRPKGGAPTVTTLKDKANELELFGNKVEPTNLASFIDRMEIKRIPKSVRRVPNSEKAPVKLKFVKASAKRSTSAKPKSTPKSAKDTGKLSDSAKGSAMKKAGKRSKSLKS